MQDAWVPVLPTVTSLTLTPEEQPTNALTSPPDPVAQALPGGGVPAKVHTQPLTSKGSSKAGTTHQRNGRGRAGQGRGGGKGCVSGVGKATMKKNGHIGTVGNVQGSDEGDHCTPASDDYQGELFSRLALHGVLPGIVVRRNPIQHTTLSS